MAAVRSVAVVGRDTAAWVMALGLRRALARIGMTVTVVELPSALGPADVHAALPSLANLHALLGLNEDALYARCGAVPSLGQQFAGWSAAPFVHGYDVSRPAINDVDFVQFWSLARRQGMRVAFEDFSLAAAAAKQGRIGVKAGRAGEAPSPGYHIGAQAYAALLRQGCVAAGIEIRPSASVSVEREDERVRAVLLDEGTRIEADLFVDASGSERALIGGEGFESWSDAFPATHLLTGAIAPITPPPAHARIVATPEGWVGLFPLQGLTAVAGHFTGDVRRLLAAAGIGPIRDLAVRPFEAGMLRRSWIGNVVAAGETSVAIERLDAAEIHLLQAALSNLVALWPVDRDMMPEARDYDRAIASHAGNIRDFQQAHYLLSDRPESFWVKAREAKAPADLAARLALFGARGILSHRDDETFLPQSWTAMMIGHGLVPAESDPAVARTPQEEQIGKIQQLLRLIAEDVRAMPGMGDFLAAKGPKR